MKKNILSLSLLASLATAYSGDLTYFTTGLGSCGISSTDNDAIVALSLPMVRTIATSFSISRTNSGLPSYDWERKAPNTYPTYLNARAAASGKES